MLGFSVKIATQVAIADLIYKGFMHENPWTWLDLTGPRIGNNDCSADYI